MLLLLSLLAAAVCPSSFLNFLQKLTISSALTISDFQKQIGTCPMAFTRSSCEVREKQVERAREKTRERLGREVDFRSMLSPRCRGKEEGKKLNLDLRPFPRRLSPTNQKKHQKRLLLPVRRRHPRPPLARQEDREAQVLRLPGVCQPGRRRDRRRRDGRLPHVFAAALGESRGPGGRAPDAVQGGQPHFHENPLEAARGQEGEQEADPRGGLPAAGAGGQGRRQAGREDQEVRDRLPVRAAAGEHPGGGRAGEAEEEEGLGGGGEQGEGTGSGGGGAEAGKKGKDSCDDESDNSSSSSSSEEASCEKGRRTSSCSCSCDGGSEQEKEGACCFDSADALFEARSRVKK